MLQVFQPAWMRIGWPCGERGMLPALDRGVFALVIEQPKLGGVGIDTVLLVFDKGIVFPAVSQAANHIDELRGGLWKTGSANHMRVSGSIPFKATCPSCSRSPLKALGGGEAGALLFHACRRLFCFSKMAASRTSSPILPLDWTGAPRRSCQRQCAIRWQSPACVRYRGPEDAGSAAPVCRFR